MDFAAPTTLPHSASLPLPPRAVAARTAYTIPETPSQADEAAQSLRGIADVATVAIPIVGFPSLVSGLLVPFLTQWSAVEVALAANSATSNIPTSLAGIAVAVVEGVAQSANARNAHVRQSRKG